MLSVTWGLLLSLSRCTFIPLSFLFFSLFCACGVLHIVLCTLYSYGDVKLTMTVLELAGSRFAGWISCFLCSESENGGQQREHEAKSQYLYMAFIYTTADS